MESLQDQDLAQRELSASLDLSQGYFAGKEVCQVHFRGQRAATGGRVDVRGSITELTIAMEVDYFQLNRAEYFCARHHQDPRE